MIPEEIWIVQLSSKLHTSTKDTTLGHIQPTCTPTQAGGLTRSGKDPTCNSSREIQNHDETVKAQKRHPGRSENQENIPMDNEADRTKQVGHREVYALHEQVPVVSGSR
eukprot:COSAG05_NODE_650_length_8102_cov_16.263383_12_plen_109_part_00